MNTLRLLRDRLAIPTGTASGPPHDDDPERGDVPGWVLITLMTAGLPPLTK